jgi:FtsP/CotA-like multicopper oxidase with cupredoxin domain
MSGDDHSARTSEEANVLGRLERPLTRRALLRAGGLAALGGAGVQLLSMLPGATGTERARAVGTTVNLAATDGFVYAPGTVPNPANTGTLLLPDPLAPPPFTMWGFGFRNVTGLSASQIQAQRGKFQAPAPMLWFNEGEEVRIVLRNLGLTVRPDLTDSHTIHWHGFRNAIPLFDGVPEVSIAVPIGRDFTYFYRPEDPGTYMYHCHFEDTEHVSMGMTGIVFVRPAQNAGNPGLAIPQARVAGGAPTAPMGYAYNDGVDPTDGRSTAYDREFGMFLSEAWAQEHFDGAHIQEHDWSEYKPDLWFLNGRAYPDTLEPNGLGSAASGDLIEPPGRPDLKYQPLSSLVQANSDDRVLLRFVNLGFQQHAMTLDGIPMQVVGKDATLLRGRDGTFLEAETNTIYIGPGESVDAIFTAPVVASQTTFLLYDRNLAYLHNPGLEGRGGQMTEVRIVPAGTLAAQVNPNT